MPADAEKRRPLWDFKEEFQVFEKTGRFREEFFEKLVNLVRKRIRRRNLRSEQLGYGGQGWDEDTICDLARDFFVWHLASTDNKRIQYILDRAKDSDVDYLMMHMFDQFISERLRNKSPKKWNLRKRLKDLLDQLVAQAKVEKVRGCDDLYRLAGSSFRIPLMLEEMLDQIPEFPLHDRAHYQGGLWASRAVGKKALGDILEFVFTRVRGAVDLDTLTEFLCHRLGIRDTAIQSIDGHGENVPLLNDLGEAIGHTEHSQGGVEARTKLKRVFEGLCPRQKEIFRMAHLQPLSVPKICAALGVKKSTVYDELKKIKKVLKEELGS